jgi:Do/DeqQ family serine protease
MRRLWLIFSQAVTVALALLFVVATLKPEWLRRPPNQMLPQIVSIAAVPDGAARPGNTVGLAAAAQRASPSVVSIAASRVPEKNPHADDPWFRFFFGLRGGPQDLEPQRGLGSGVIASPEGFLITNHHVIDGADAIEVLLADGRQAQAQLIGSDPESDVAVLKIDLPSLPAVVFGNSDRLAIGESVLAIGNPFGVGQTVTAGIVSALDRRGLGLNVFENFIQTDAAINPGNSGGALVDANGHLVGINTAIFSRSGGSLGIGFAIPAATARSVMESLIRDGKVVRGWIGVEPRDFNAEMAETLRLPVQRGVLIAGVLRDGPAAAGGIQPGDVVVKIGEQPVTSTADLLGAVAALPPGSTAAIGVQRGDKALNLSVKIAQRPAVRPRPSR